jgi:hypothetical protein
MKAIAFLSLSLAVWAVSPRPAVTQEPPVIGETTREKIEANVPAWAAVEAEAMPDSEALAGLAKVAAGGDVTVYLGTWCGDSRREVSRLFRVCDELRAAGPLPFTLHFVGVDRDKKEPAPKIAADHVLYLPTLIVRRGGAEVGRIVETSPAAVEKDLLALLSGRAHGVLSASRPELTAPAQP